jgi:hypothetical protein
MERKIEFKFGGIVGGDDMRDLIDVFPGLTDKFTQRKSYDEYYFNHDGRTVHMTLDQLDKLSNVFTVTINYDSITLS